MGCRRGGFYAIDVLDNGGAPSAREIHPDLQSLAVGDVIPATPETKDGFEVLAIEPPPPRRTVSLVTRAGRALTPPERAFVELVGTLAKWPEPDVELT